MKLHLLSWQITGKATIQLHSLTPQSYQIPSACLPQLCWQRHFFLCNWWDIRMEEAQIKIWYVSLGKHCLTNTEAYLSEAFVHFWWKTIISFNLYSFLLLPGSVTLILERPGLSNKLLCTANTNCLLLFSSTVSLNHAEETPSVLLFLDFKIYHLKAKENIQLLK